MLTTRSSSTEHSACLVDAIPLGKIGDSLVKCVWPFTLRHRHREMVLFNEHAKVVAVTPAWGFGFRSSNLLRRV